MDFHSVMETFAEAWVAANTHTPLTEAAEQGLICSTPSLGHNAFLSHALLDTSNERHEITSLEAFPSCQQSSIDAENGPTIIETQKSQKSMPVHCIVEQIPGPQACGQYVELDSYAVIPGDTLFNELVRTALVKLGYSDKQILGAKGSIQIKNWKPLAFNQITENPESTLSSILGDLITFATLHIRLYSVPDCIQEWTDATVRNAVLELLREMSQIKLAKLCPLSQSMLSNIINNRYVGKIGKEKCQEFGKWYLNYRKQHQEVSSPDIVPCDKPADGRLTFHPIKELPMVRDWFQGCRNPTHRTLQTYVDLINQGQVRQQERPKITLSTLKNWWKNEKQRERKQKCENQPDDMKMKKKRDMETKFDQFLEESCDSNLQTVETIESHSLSTVSHKLAADYDEESSKNKKEPLDRRNEYLVLQGREHNRRHHQSEQLVLSHAENTNGFLKLSNLCPNQNNSIYNGLPDSFFGDHDHNKFYNSKNIQSCKKTSKNNSCQLNDRIEVDV